MALYEYWLTISDELDCNSKYAEYARAREVAERVGHVMGVPGDPDSPSVNRAYLDAFETAIKSSTDGTTEPHDEKKGGSMADQSTDNQSGTGAVRSADVAGFDYMSAPMLGWMAVARTAQEGADKYGRYNYMQGFPVHDLLNHVFDHLHRYALGDRSEPHLEHAGWGVLTAITMQVTHPELSAPHMLGPGAVITPEVQAELDRLAPILKARRASGELDQAGWWSIHDLPFVKRIKAARQAWMEAR